MNRIQCNVKQLLEPKNITGNSVDLFIYGDIVSNEDSKWNSEDSYPAEIRNFLDEANGRDINVYINSGGGSVFAGQAIASMLQRYEGKAHAFIDGLCASIATSIALSCDTVSISDNGFFMFHKAWVPMRVAGNSKQLSDAVKETCNVLNTIDTALLSIYEKHSVSEEAYETIKKSFNSGKDTWLTADEVVGLFNVQKTEATTTAYAKSEFLDMDSVPKALLVEKTIEVQEPKEDLANKYKNYFEEEVDLWA